ncbi:hypothetical protein PCH_Pc13g06430 [Penicillium rubens Wisconsin 54-1255]|uniref:Uncharacterized protein n=1 Tax=Penicillium rubens (strain ATCC 28089 / DSM 1075 / NRRL 1951 / Wisconsin 54-1255) TaxID=500485 RepID=B6H3H6_PENRW|nr:hypothetical protein PCH_Pc13g06430 [Penicillium rubens Wisconsin 54-1255]
MAHYNAESMSWALVTTLFRICETSAPVVTHHTRGPDGSGRLLSLIRLCFCCAVCLEPKPEVGPDPYYHLMRAEGLGSHALCQGDTITNDAAPCCFISPGALEKCVCVCATADAKSGVCAWQREFLWYLLSLVRLYWVLQVRTRNCTEVIYYVGIIYGWYWTWDYNGRGTVDHRGFLPHWPPGRTFTSAGQHTYNKDYEAYKNKKKRRARQSAAVIAGGGDGGW